VALTFTAGTPSQAATSITSATITLPTGLAAGDYTLLVCALNAASGVITPPAGWSELLASTPATLSTSDVCAIYYKAWVSGDTNPVVTCTSGRLAVLPVRVQGADTTTFVEVAATVTQQGTAGTTITAPSATTVASTDVCHVFNGRSATSGTIFSWTAPAGDTLVGQANGQATAATNAGGLMSTTAVAVGGASGTKTSTASATVTGGMGVSWVIKEAVAATVASPRKLDVVRQAVNRSAVM
jgi:hypothetical protein